MYAEHQNGDRELYDLVKDPYELQSEHANPAYDAIKGALSARLHKLVSCAGASCRTRPTVRFTATRRARCGTMVATVSGSNLASVRFTINGRPGGTDAHAPFQIKLRDERRIFLRARVATRFDQFVTVDRTVRACG